MPLSALQLPPSLQSDSSPPASCHFMSFGISYDFSFDQEMYEKYRCTGLALDPTVDHPYNITQGVTFLKAGAHSSGEDSLPPGSVVWSVPSLLQVWKAPFLHVLKMDCEGCEYQLAYDVMQDDPNFFHRILQLNIEIHLPKAYMKSDVEAKGLAKLYRLLTAAGLHLIHMDEGKCSNNDQKAGCSSRIVAAGIPCVPGCQSFLFSRILNA